MNNRMNIADIAELAGVSKAAVSRYFNQGYISEEKRQLIQKVVEATGYQPSAQAQTLRTKKTRTVGVILPKINSDSIGRVVAGISEVLDQKGYQLLLGNTYNNPKKELEYLSFFDGKRVDGVIFIATVLTPKHKRILERLDVPVILVGQHLTGYNCVYHDDYNAMKSLTQLMLQRGTKEIGYLGVTLQDQAVGGLRQQGFIDAVNEEMQEPQKTEKFWKERCVLGDFSLEAGYEGAKILLSKFPDLNRIVCATDQIAIGAMSYIKQYKAIPKEFQIAGIGDSQMSKVTTPTLTTVHYHYKKSGIEAATILMGCMEQKETVRKEIKMGFEIVQQESTQ